VININEHLAVLIAAIEALTIVITDTCASDRHDLSIRVLINPCILTPQTDRDAKTALISYDYVATVFHGAGLLYVYLG
jgi:hypothetical protein